MGDQPITSVAAGAPAPLAAGGAAPRPLLVATDGLPQSDVAIAAACELTRGHDVQVLTVIEAVPSAPPQYADPRRVEEEALRRADALARARMQVHRQAPGTHWPVFLATGAPTHEIARMARDTDARLVVAGLGRHGARDRVLGRETVLHLLQECTVPVLAVGPGGFARPTRLLVAVDFSRETTRVVGAALALAAPGAHVTLLHVIDGTRVPTSPARRDALDAEVTGCFAALLERLAAPAGITLDTLTAVGDPAREVLAVADQLEASLVVLGTHGHGVMSRLLLGSVSTAVLRGADRSVLVVPRLAEDTARYRPAFTPPGHSRAIPR